MARRAFLGSGRRPPFDFYIFSLDFYISHPTPSYKIEPYHLKEVTQNERSKG